MTIREALFEAMRRADAGIVPVNYARDHGYRHQGTAGYVTDNDWHAFRADAALSAIEAAGSAVVPVEATPHMIAAAVGWRERDSTDGLTGELDMFERVWRAAIEAAKEQP